MLTPSAFLWECRLPLLSLRYFKFNFFFMKIQRRINSYKFLPLFEIGLFMIVKFLN